MLPAPLRGPQGLGQTFSLPAHTPVPPHLLNQMNKTQRACVHVVPSSFLGRPRVRLCEGTGNSLPQEKLG